MSAAIKWISPSGSLGTIPESVIYSKLLEAESANSITFKIISGNLPDGLIFRSDGRISGIPDLVSKRSTSTFVVRATDNLGNIADRTFSITVQGQDIPEFITPSGRIGTFYDGTKVDIDIEYTDTDPDETLIIKLLSGSLPPGVSIDSSGKIFGFIEPFRRPSEESGYDITDFDEYDFDFDNNSISKNYEFTLEVSDGRQSSLRTFEIFVYALDSMTSDNTNITGDNTFITADVVPERLPVLTTTETDLGTVRADNYHAFKFDAIDFDDDPIEFILKGNVPDGLEFDSSSGWLYGYIPNQGAVERNFSFDVTVTKANSIFYELTLDDNIVVNIQSGYYVSQGDINTTEINPLGRIISSPAPNKLIVRKISTVDFIPNQPIKIRKENRGLPVSVDSTGLPQVENYTVDGLYENIPLDGGSGTGATADFIVNGGKVSTVRFNVGGQNYKINDVLTVDNYLLLTEHDDNISYNEGDYTRFGLSLYRASKNVPVGVGIENEEFWQNLSNTETHDKEEEYFQNDIVKIENKIYRATQNVPTDIEITNGNYWDFLTSLDNTELAVTIDQLDNGPILDSASLVSSEKYFITPRVFNGEEWVDAEANTFTIRVIGEIEKFVTWLSPEDLGTVKSGSTSELATVAESSYSDPLFYRLNQGSLPPGTTLLSSGEVAGLFNGIGSTIDPDSSLLKEYSFTVEVFTQDGFISTLKDFSITVDYSDAVPQQSLYIKAMPPQNDRDVINNLLFNRDVLPPSSIYRRNDPNFGIADSVIYHHAFGLEPKTLDEYIAALSQNHYKKRLILGPIKSARALNPDNSVRYEVIYSEIVDPALNKNLQSIPKEIEWPNTVTLNNGNQTNKLYPNSLINMRKQLFDSIGLREFMLPDWMTSNQENGRPLGFVPAWVIAYVKPSEGKKLAYRVREFIERDLNKVDFEVERYVLEGTGTQFWNAETQSWEEVSSSNEVSYVDDDRLDKYLAFTNQTILG